ncbi:MAG: metalloregulator ArsR/SmtB family transcription factor [Pseudomonadota bacterium]|nr:metalloregulator ArsR/SmtB family transcription factor [Pseudomonadota bacterium]|tara:strand:- start:266 stop:673 length:408 start_codon:yes stop_codon:yes gene_type:complete
MLENFEHVSRSIADTTRVRILKMLEPGELCVCQITAILGLAPATVSKHLSLLRMAGLLSQRKEGRWVYYCLSMHDNNPYAPPVLELLRDILEDDPIIEEDRARLKKVNGVPLEALCGEGRHLFNKKMVATKLQAH